MRFNMNILYSLKDRFKRTVTYVLMICIFIFLVVTLAYYQSENNKNNNRYLRGMKNVAMLEEQYRNHYLKSQHTTSEEKQYHQYVIDISRSIVESIENNDYHNANLFSAKWWLFYWLECTSLNDEWIELEPQQDKYMQSPEQYFGTDKFNEIIEILDYQLMDVHNNDNRRFFEDYYAILEITYSFFYYYDLYVKGIPMQLPFSTNPHSFIYSIYSSNFPNIIFLLAIILGVMSVNYKDDSLKMNLFLKANRSKLFYRRFLETFIWLMVIFIIPLILILIINGINNGFYGLNYPILINKNSIESIRPDMISYESSLIHKGNPYLTNIRVLGLSEIVLNRMFSVTFENYQFFSLWKILLIQHGVLLLGITFWLSIGQFIAALCKKVSLKYLVTLSVFILPYIIKVIFPSIKYTLFDVSSYTKISDIFSGLVPYTVLSLAIVYIVGIIVFYNLGRIIFKKKNI